VSDGTWAPSADFWRYRPVAVTGATGFVGSHLVGFLVDLDAAVVILTRDSAPPTTIGAWWRDRVTVVRGQVEDQATLERLLGEFGVITVVHLAAQAQAEVANNNPVSTFEANIRGTWSLLEAVRRSPQVGQVVTASTDSAYGDHAALPYVEDLPLLAVAPHDASKACADLLTISYARSFQVPAVIARCGSLFGPGDTNWDRLVPGAVRDLLAGRRPVIRADRRLTRDYLYVIDAALSYLHLAEVLAERPELAGEAFNFSVERPLTVRDLIEMVQIAAGIHLEPDFRAPESDTVVHQFLSAAKAREVLGWEAGHTVEEALILTVRWYRENLSAGRGYPVPAASAAAMEP